jgi:hypothetical protein
MTDKQQATSGTSHSNKSLLTRFKEAPVMIKVLAGFILFLFVTACIGIPIYWSKSGGKPGITPTNDDKTADKGKSTADKDKLAQSVKDKIQAFGVAINAVPDSGTLDVDTLKAELDQLKKDCASADLDVKVSFAPLSGPIENLVTKLIEEASRKAIPAEREPIATKIDDLIILGLADSLQESKGAEMIAKLIEKREAEAKGISEEAKKKNDAVNKLVQDLISHITKLDSKLDVTELSARVAQIRKDCDDAKLQAKNILKSISAPIKALIEKLIEEASTKEVATERVPIATKIDELISLKLLDSPLKDSKGVDLKDPKGSDLIARRVNEKKAVEDAKKTLSDEQKAEETKRLEEEKRKRAEAKRQEMIDAEKARKEAVAKEEAKKKAEAANKEVHNLGKFIDTQDSKLDMTILNAKLNQIHAVCTTEKLSVDDVLMPLGEPIKNLVNKLAVEAASIKKEADRTLIAAKIDDLIKLGLAKSLKGSAADLIAHLLEEKKKEEEAERLAQEKLTNAAKEATEADGNAKKLSIEAAEAQKEAARLEEEAKNRAGDETAKQEAEAKRAEATRITAEAEAAKQRAATALRAQQWEELNIAINEYTSKLAKAISNLTSPICLELKNLSDNIVEKCINFPGESDCTKFQTCFKHEIESPLTVKITLLVDVFANNLFKEP